MVGPVTDTYVVNIAKDQCTEMKIDDLENPRWTNRVVKDEIYEWCEAIGIESWKAGYRSNNMVEFTFTELRFAQLFKIKWAP